MCDLHICPFAARQLRQHAAEQAHYGGQQDAQLSGWLIGPSPPVQNDQTVVSIVRCQGQKPAASSAACGHEREIVAVQALLPYGLDVVGAYVLQANAVQTQALARDVAALVQHILLVSKADQTRRSEDFLADVARVSSSSHYIVQEGTPSGRRTASLTFCPISGPASLHSSTAHLDVLCYAPPDMPLSDAAAQVLRPALRRQLAGMRVLLQSLRNLQGVQALHFRPPKWPHHLTVLYPSCVIRDEASQAAITRRQQLHRLLSLPADRPLLRSGNAVSFQSLDTPSGAGRGGGPGSNGPAGRLSDVHFGLPPSGVAGGTCHLVDGAYDYYHYMQDKFDDAGWGCAYRSLQTLCSWFVRQWYTGIPVPSHRQIQQALVDLGDKPSKFVGSRQWIGAIELSYVLDSLVGVTSKIITVSSGAEMGTKAREIAQHFDQQGTPIMIGGGVLAYTLLGIDVNERTGDCAFLILDPHYTGGEDLGRIHQGSWVAWKRAGEKAAAGGDLFIQDAFYNLLCPQRPVCV
ncbi:hypothetical protein WJX72_000610 [[Myrmecia] bisecta]|uniref:Ufm1-specific protease n=1 Tax=[Myrmecia] bisecta TaxID=41462 RepID=A0AAW1QP14_9CHLO